MSIQPIQESELRAMGVSSLAERPSTPSLYGGRPLSAEELRAAFDRLPRLIAARLNALITALGMNEEDVERVTDAIPSGIAEGHTLSHLLRDITDGSFATYLSADGVATLAERLDELMARTILPEGYFDLLSYIDHPSGTVARGVPRPVSGDAVRTAVDEGIGTHDRASGAHTALQYELRTEDESVYRAVRDQFRLCREEDGSYRLYCNTAPRDAVPQFSPVAASERILIPRDMVVSEGSVRICEAAGEPLPTLAVGESYLDLLLNNGEHLYVRVADLLDRMTVVTEGEGDLVTHVSVDGATMTLTKGASCSDFVTVPAFDARLERLESAADDAFFSRRTVTEQATRIAMPADAVGSAELTLLGGRTRRAYEAENLLSLAGLSGDGAGITYSYDEETDVFLFQGTAYEELSLSFPPLYADGRALKGVLEVLSGEIGSTEATVSLCDSSGYPLFTLPLREKDEPTVFDLSSLGTYLEIGMLRFTIPPETPLYSFTFRLAVSDHIKCRLVPTRPQAVEGMTRADLPPELQAYANYGEGIDEVLYNAAQKTEDGWHFRTRVQRRVLSGTEKVTVLSETPDAYGLYCYRITLGTQSGTNTSLRVLCSHYEERSAATPATPGVSLELASRKLVLSLYTEVKMTAEEVSAMLSAWAANGEPLTVVHQMAREQTLALTCLPRSVYVLADSTGGIRCQTDTGKPVPFALTFSVPGGRFAEVEHRVDELAHSVALRSWREVQRVVREGRAADYFRVGDVLLCDGELGEMAWVIIGLDHDTPTDTAFSHSMTLQAAEIECLAAHHRQEALFAVENALPAGDYYFTLPAGVDEQNGGGRTYTFQATATIPDGAVLCFDWQGGAAADVTLDVYLSASSRTPSVRYVVNESQKGKDLAALALSNDAARIRYGIPYAESEMDSWLAGTIDAPYPDENLFLCRGNPPGDGYLCGLDEEFLAVLGAVDKRTSRVDGTTETLSRRVFLLSEGEVGLPEREGYDEGAPYAYYTEAIGATPNAGVEPVRVREGGRWWLRTAVGSEATRAAVGTQGEGTSAAAPTALGVLPACCIV